MQIWCLQLIYSQCRIMSMLKEHAVLFHLEHFTYNREQKLDSHGGVRRRRAENTPICQKAMDLLRW